MMMAMGYAAGLIGSGFLSARLDHRQDDRAVPPSPAAAPSSSSPRATPSGRSASGFSSSASPTGIYLPSGITTITASVSPANWGKALSVHELAPSLAFIAAPLIVEGPSPLFPLAGGPRPDRRRLPAPGALLSPPRTGGRLQGRSAHARGNIRLLIGKPAFWIMGALFSLAITASMGIYSMMPLYLVAERGIDRSLANTLLSLSRIPVLAMALLSGWISDRFGPKPTVAAVILFNGLTDDPPGRLPGQVGRS